MFGFGRSKRIQSVASVSAEFSAMCRTVAGSLTANQNIVLDDDDEMLFLGFRCGVAVMLCENSKLDSDATNEVLLRIVEQNVIKSKSRETFNVLNDLLGEQTFVHAVATGKTAVNHWSAIGGFPVAGGSLLADLFIAHHHPIRTHQDIASH